jgi:hypothetical protein
MPCANTTTTISNGCPDPLSQLVNILTAQSSNLTENVENPTFLPAVIPSSNADCFAASSPSVAPVSSSEMVSSSPITSLPSSSTQEMICSSPVTSLLPSSPAQEIIHLSPTSLPSSSAQEIIHSSPVTSLPSSSAQEIIHSSPTSLPPSSSQEVSSKRVHISSTITPIPLWRRKNDPSNNDCEVDPRSLEHVMTFLVSKVDTLTAQLEELQSKSIIMQNCLFKSLNDNLDAKFKALQQENRSKLDMLSTDSTIRQCADICDNFKYDIEKKVEDIMEVHKIDFDKKFEDASKDNEEMRRLWDNHMENIRARVFQRDDLSEDEDDDDDDEYNLNDLHDTIVPDNPRPSDIMLQKLQKDIEQLKSENHKLDVRLVQAEQYSRRESLVFSGVPAVIPHENLEKVMLAVMMCLGFKDITYDDIVACHRLWSSPDSREPAKVIVKFTNRKVVEWSLAHPENLAIVKQTLGLDLEMAESLCPANVEVQRLCKWLKENGHIHHFYSRNGFWKVVRAEGDYPVRITHPEHLRNKFVDLEFPSFNR